MFKIKSILLDNIRYARSLVQAGLNIQETDFDGEDFNVQGQS